MDGVCADTQTDNQIEPPKQTTTTEISMQTDDLPAGPSSPERNVISETLMESAVGTPEMSFNPLLHSTMRPLGIYTRPTRPVHIPDPPADLTYHPPTRPVTTATVTSTTENNLPEAADQERTLLDHMFKISTEMNEIVQPLMDSLDQHKECIKQFASTFEQINHNLMHQQSKNHRRLLLNPSRGGRMRAYSTTSSVDSADFSLSPTSSSNSTRSSASFTKRQRISNSSYSNTQNAEGITADAKMKVASIKREDIVILDKPILNATVKEEYNDLRADWASRGSNENDPVTLTRIKELMVVIGQQARSIPPLDYKEYARVPHLCTFLTKMYCNHVTTKTGDMKVYYGEKLDDAYTGLKYKEYDCLGCVSCEDSVANGLCTKCWTASRCMRCIKQLGCEICLTSDNVNPISFKKPIVRQASHVRSPKLINNDEVNVAFLNALPDKTTWLEAIGSDQIKLVEGVSVFIDLVSRGFNKGGCYEQAVAKIRDVCTSKGWDQEALAIDAHDNLARAHYLTKGIPRFRSKWGTKTLICPYCRRKFVNGVS